MTCEIELFLHYVMTAHDLLEEAANEKEKVKKLELLNQAMKNLDYAQSSGAPPETLKELRNMINNRFMEVVNDKL